MLFLKCSRTLIVAVLVTVWSGWSVRESIASQAAGQETLVGIVGKDFVLLGAGSSVSSGIALTASNLDKIAPLVEPFEYDGQEDDRPACITQQQCIVAAAAGDAAMSDRLIGLLKAQAAIREYEAGVGCDVEFVNMRTSATGNTKTETVEAGMTVEAMAYFARSQLAEVRPGANVCFLIAGMMLSNKDDEENEFAARPSFLSHQVQQQVQQAWKQDTTTTGDTATTTPIEQDASATVLSLRPHLYWLDELGSLQKIQYGAHGLGSNFCLSVLDQGYRSDMTLDQATQLLRDCFQQLRTRYLVNSPQPPCIKCVDANGIRLIR